MSLACDELSDRIRRLLPENLALREQRMFGGVCFMLNGNMLVCPMKSGDLLVRTGPDLIEKALARPGARRMDMNGRAMKGYVEVSADSIEDEEPLAYWVDLARSFVETLPPK
jgi:TfoX/Sxy family transcriptional regulator of competence genes